MLKSYAVIADAATHSLRCISPVILPTVSVSVTLAVPLYGAAMVNSGSTLLRVNRTPMVLAL